MNRRFIFLANSRSGSFDRELVDEMLAEAERAGLGKAELCLLPDAVCPTPESLGEDDLVAVFGGDGTISSVVRELAGWGGAVLILPGGTMNLASKRLHGEQDAMAILAAVAAGQARRARPAVIRTAQGDSLAGVMVGPGTAWSDVREAMRDLDLAGLAASSVRAFATTSTGARVACTIPPVGRPEGYPMIEALPTASGMELSGYYADDVGEFALGLATLLRHDFRAGPHESFALDGPVTLSGVDGEDVGILIDGEPVEEERQVILTVGSSKVDLLVTAADA